MIEHLNVIDTEFETGGIDDEMIEAITLEIDNMYGVEQYLGQIEMEDMVVSDSEDKDFTAEDDSYDELIDDIIFNENIDKDAERVGTTREMNSEDNLTSSDEDGLKADIGSDFNSVGSNDFREDSERPSTSEEPTFRLGQIFSTNQTFKDVVNNYSVKIERPTKFEKIDVRMIYVRYKKKDEGCVWHMNALKVKDEASFQIREIDLTHTCGRQYHMDNAKTSWLVQKFEKSFRCNPKKSVKGFRNCAITKLSVYISPHQAFKARQKTLKMIEGDTTE
ncbi:hypothetical protein C2S53_005659 [Perilla frutescens var. hirtella]|uniref:Transposase MuDR plant domain-containing protein n=1 Tax=Perilla frutescens var. hirtella TaxID=608512 RepID=A0AAD4JEF4_PERFH|nr:hypothetical protein C2S53_005659 [Perilla frutescens var. hirtella]